MGDPDDQRRASIEQAVSAAGLRAISEHLGAIGERAGFAVELSLVAVEGGHAALRFAARIDPKVAPAIRAAFVKDAKRLMAIPVFAGSVRLDDGVLVYVFAPHSMAKLEGRLLDAVDAILAVATGVAPPPPAQCRVCGSEQGAPPRIVNHIVDRLCRPCEAKLAEIARREREAQDARPVRWGRALAAGAAASFLGAIVWLGVLVVAHLQHGALAAGIGLGVGLATRYAAGKPSPIVDVITAVGSVASTAGPLLLLLALAALGDPAESFGKLLSGIARDLVFAGCAGLLGGLGAVRLSETIITAKKRI